jgi:WD40 repeat protein
MLSSVRLHGLLSPDGRVVLDRNVAGPLELWDAATGKPRANLGNPEGPAELLRFSPDGRLLAAAAHGGAVWLWDLDGLPEKSVLEGAGDEVVTLVFSGDGAALAVGTDQQVTVWDTRTHEPRARVPGPFEPVAVTPGADRLFLQSRSGARLRLVELPSGQVLHEAEGNTFLALSPAGDRLLTVDGNRKVSSCDAAAFGATASPAWMQFLRILVVISLFATGLVVLGLVVFLVQVNDRPAYLLAFNADGSTLASASTGNLKLWDVAGERLRARLDMPPARPSVAGGPVARLLGELTAYSDSLLRVRAMGFTPDGRTLVTLDDRGDGRLWDVAEGRQTASFRLGGTITAAALGPDGRALATVVEGKSAAQAWLTLWDVDPAGKVFRRVAVPVAGTRLEGSFPVFVADGRGLAFLSRLGLQLWDVVPGGLRERPVPEGIGTGAGAMALSPDGRMIAFYLRTKKQGMARITFGDLATERACGELVRRQSGLVPDPRRLTELPSSLTFAPDGLMVVGFGEGQERLWDTLTGRPLGNLQRVGNARTTAVAFSRDGRTLAIGDTAGGVTWLDVDVAVRAGRKAAQAAAEQGWRGALAQIASHMRDALDEAAQG